MGLLRCLGQIQRCTPSMVTNLPWSQASLRGIRPCSSLRKDSKHNSLSSLNKLISNDEMMEEAPPHFTALYDRVSACISFSHHFL